MHSYYLNLFSMTPNLLFCSLILLSLSPILLFYSPTLFSSTPKVFSASPTLLSCSPKILFGNPNLLSCSPILLSCSLLKYVATRKIRVKNNNYKNNKTQLKTTNGRLLTHASYVCKIFQIKRNLRYLHSNREELAKGIATHA